MYNIYIYIYISFNISMSDGSLTKTKYEGHVLHYRHYSCLAISYISPMT